MPATVSISEPVAKYLTAVLLDPTQLKTSDQMRDHALEHLGRVLFGSNFEHLANDDARALVLEAMRESVWQ